MKSRIRSLLASIALLGLALTLLAPPAGALSPTLEKAKKDGVVGEQIDGYLGLVTGSAPADVRKEMDDVNGQRKALYEERAKAQGTDARTYAAVVGKRQVEREPKGNWVRAEQGWRKK
jgi:hypothetical protein